MRSSELHEHEMGAMSEKRPKKVQELHRIGQSVWLDTIDRQMLQSGELERLRVRGFAAAVQESNPDAQREVIERVFTRIAIRDDQVVDVDMYPVYAEAFRWYLRPRADSNRRSPP
jgi:hypothetical protein